MRFVSLVIDPTSKHTARARFVDGDDAYDVDVSLPAVDVEAVEREALTVIAASLHDRSVKLLAQATATLAAASKVAVVGGDVDVVPE